MAGVWHAASVVPFQVSSMPSHLYTSPVPWLVSQPTRTCGDHLTLPEFPRVKIAAFFFFDVDFQKFPKGNQMF